MLPAAALLAAFCASPLPVLVLDSFSARGAEATMDLDGDGVPDAAHGDYIAALYRARGRDAIVRDMDGRSDPAGLAGHLNEIAAEVEAGRLKISAVSFSQTANVRFDALIPGANGVPLSAGDVGERREELLAALLSFEAAMRIEAGGFRRLASAARRLEAAGVPLIGIAGNEGPEVFNLLNVLPGAVSVGALARDGSKAAFSGDNSLVAVWAPGEHVVAAAYGGVDLDGDGRSDVASSVLSGGAPLAARWAGKPAIEVVSRAKPDHSMVDHFSRETAGGIARLRQLLGDKLYPARFLAEYFNLPAFRLRGLEARGDYYDASLRLPFTIDAGGLMAFDPERSGRPGQLRMFSGTSYAPPFLCPRR